MRIFVYFTLALGLGATPAASETTAVENMVRAMVELKRTGATCESYVRGSPMSVTSSIDAYFATLNQPVPNTVDQRSKDSIGKLIKQHAAYVCSTKLVKAQDNYLRAAASYMETKPAQWPDAPWIDFPQWCQDPACADY
jgi:galactitol-specific phosphotransferase system IIB component